MRSWYAPNHTDVIQPARRAGRETRPMTTAPGTTRWGVLGPGRIARTFARDLRLVPGAELAAVGSRSLERATAFAAEHGAAAAYGSYEGLLDDRTVDAVYVATPHGL